MRCADTVGGKGHLVTSRRRALWVPAGVLPAAFLVLGSMSQASSASPIPALSRSAGAAHAAVARPPRWAAGTRVVSSRPKAYHPEHASPGVLAIRGEPVHSSSGGRFVAPRSSSRPAESVSHFRIGPLACAVPSAPGGVGAAAGANQVIVTWSAAQDNGTAISAYVVREATGPDTGASIATGGSATTATLTGLSGGTAATFSVVAESSCGTGPPGTSSPATPTGSASTYVGSVLANTPSAFYRLDEPIGTTVMADSSGSKSDGSYSGQETLGETEPLASDPATSTGYSTCCSGIGSGSPSLPLFNTARTVEAWVDTTSATANQAIVGWGPTGTNEAFIVSINAQAVGVDTYNDYLQFPTLRPLDNGTWHEITVTYNATTVEVYLDGQEVGTANFSGTVNTLDPSGLSLAGFSGYNMFNGDLADVAVYPSALSPAEVAAHFAASGYSVPTAAKDVNVSYGGSNAADVTWGHATANGVAVSGYLVSALGGAEGTPSVAVPGDATAARLTGLAAGSYTFEVVAMDPYGNGPGVKTTAFSVTGSASTYVSTVLSSRPSAFYRLDDSTAAAMTDSSGNAATGVYTSSATLGLTGPLANDAATSISDNGGGPAALADPSLPLYAETRTLEAWVNTTNSGLEWVAGYGTTSTDAGFAVGVQPGDVYVSGYSDDLAFPSASTTIDDGQWHFVVVTTNGASATVYLDGADLGTQNFPHSLNTVATGPQEGLAVGADIEGCCGYFQGDLADVAVFPSALSGTQVTAQFAASGLGRPPAPGGPAAVAGANQATVSWTAPTGSAPPVTGYLITALKAGAPANSVSVAASATSTIITGLAGGTAYTFEVQALNEYGAGTAATTTVVTPTGPASTYVSTVLSSDPSVFYRLADGDLGAMADSSGNGATGEYSTSASTLGVAGPLGNDAATAISDNANGPAAHGAPALPLYAQPRTLEGWVNTTNGGEEFLAGYGSTAAGEGFAVAVQPGDVFVSGYNDDLTFATTSIINDGQWHFVVVTSNGTSATVYLDGVDLGTQSFPSSLDTVSAPQGLFIGSDIDGCCADYQGDLADVAVFPSALSSSQVTAQFAASGLGRPPAPTKPKAVKGANQVTVSWTAPSGSDPAVTGYLVTALKGGAQANAVSVAASTTTATVTGLVGGTAYTFEVQALNEYGAGTAATTAAVTPTGATTTYASTVLSADPSVFYRLGDSDLGAMADSSGNGATGEYYPAASTLGQPGPIANDAATAIADNASGPAAHGDPTLPLYAEARTLEGWVNTTNGALEWLAGYGTTSNGAGFGVGVQPGDVYVSGYNDDLTFSSGSTTIDDGQWHFVVVTTNGTSATVYLDGVSLGTENFSSGLDTVAAPQGLFVGSDIEGCCGDFQGDLADVAVFPSALSGTQVTAQFAASGLGRPAAPIGPSAVAGANRATVSWTAPSGADPAVTGYLITALKGGAAANSVSVAASATSTIVTGLAGGTAYTFEVQALNEYGAGAAATTAAVTPTGTASTYASTVLSADPSVFYRLGDSDLGAMADSSGNGATGDYSTSASTLGVAGPLANDPSTAISDSSASSAGHGAPSLPLYDQPRSLEAWVNTTNGGELFLAGYGTTTMGEGFTVAMQPDDVIVSGYGDDLAFTSTSVLNDGQWHFIVATTNGASATVYVDGVSLGSQNFPESLDTLPASQGFVLGSGIEGCCGNFQGDLADVAVFPSALSSTQVTAQFAASGLGRPAAPTKPKAVKGANQVTVSWTAPTGSDPALSGYLVTALAGGTPANAVSVAASATGTLMTGLAGGTAYTFEIQALNEYGAGPAATTAAVTPTGSASTYASTVLSEDPSVFYRLGDADLGAMADSSGNGATGQYYAAASTLGVAGPLANDSSTAISDNADGPAGRGTPTLPLGASARTLEGWVNTTSGGEDILAGYGITSGAQGFAVATQPNDVIVSGYSDDLSFSSTSALNDGHWHFVVATTNGTSATVYVDGVSLGTQSFPEALNTVAAPQGFLVGAGVEGCCGYFQGDLADVAVFPVALSAAQVTAEYTASGDSAAQRHSPKVIGHAPAAPIPHGAASAPASAGAAIGRTGAGWRVAAPTIPPSRRQQLSPGVSRSQS
jgi:large repetitive protein